MHEPVSPGALSTADRSRSAEDRSAIAAEPDTFVLYRILGNDLEPRHRKGQTRTNLAFLLEREGRLADCEKGWIVNRIVDEEEEAAILGLLAAHGERAIRIPFVPEAYRALGWAFDTVPGETCLGRAFQDLDADTRSRFAVALCRLRNDYVTNNNGARNAALADGRGRAKWVLPWDGNCFVTPAAWSAIRAAVAAAGACRYVVVPMQRLVDNEACLGPEFVPDPADEPQLIFRRDAPEAFNPAFVWGRRPKVELFWRLGISGRWDRFVDDPWDPPRRPPSPEAGAYVTGGWVARLFSGVTELEAAVARGGFVRGVARREAIVSTIFALNRRLAPRAPDPCGLVFYASSALEAARLDLRAGTGPLAALGAEIVAEAERMRRLGPYSVTDKPRLAGSLDRHDYVSPAPYFWPDPDRPDGLPYVRRDGQRAPFAELFSPASEAFDRSRWQRMVDGTTSLALGWALTGRADFADRGALFVRTWFVAPATRMSPHLERAQVRLGHDGDRGSRHGIIELKDLYYLLDAVRLLERSGSLDAEDVAGLRAWLGDYLGWLEESDRGKDERSAANNHGSYFDLQVAAIQSYLGDRAGLAGTFLRSMCRMRQHFEPDGRQPAEEARATRRHYLHFNLQGWLHLLLLLERSGFQDPDRSGDPYRRLAAAVRGLVGTDWPGGEPFDADRIHPLLAFAGMLDLRDGDGPAIEVPVPAAGVKGRFDPLSGIAPWWQLALR